MQRTLEAGEAAILEAGEATILEAGKLDSDIRSRRPRPPKIVPAQNRSNVQKEKTP